MNKDIKSTKDDIKREAKSILNMFLSTSKTVFFKFVLGKFIKIVCKRNSIDLEALSKLDRKSEEYKTQYKEVLNTLAETITPIIGEELDYIIQSKIDYRERNK